MKSSQPYKLGIRGLSLTIFFRLVFLMYLYYSINNITVNYGYPIMKVFTWLEIGMLLLVLIEAVIYGWIQSRIQTKLWVRVHVWSLAFVLVLMPALMMGMVFIAQLLEKEDMKTVIRNLYGLKFYLWWGCTIAGHGAFIFVLIKSLRKKTKLLQNEEPGGILDEFTAE